eukprot:TRINITY_DN2990_c0_g1_i1.p1 TRINITY_DN2990_c0_g1~~TRINITY_DN2990_c0_g1_i1.p1  ORF type:complete len:245 (+),score=63.85 TRINITY_DN2990_c0_g1_i1:147-881(+)
MEKKEELGSSDEEVVMMLTGEEERVGDREGRKRKRSDEEEVGGSGEQGREDGNDDAPETSEKRRKRLESNRQSAARSRQRKKEYLTQVEQRNLDLENENRTLKRQNFEYEQRINQLEDEIKEFNKRTKELMTLLRSSNKADQITIPHETKSRNTTTNYTIIPEKTNASESVQFLQLPPLELIAQQTRQDYPTNMHSIIISTSTSPCSSPLSSLSTYSLRFPTLPNPRLEIRIPPETINTFQEHK